MITLFVSEVPAEFMPSIDVFPRASLKLGVRPLFDIHTCRGRVLNKRPAKGLFQSKAIELFDQPRIDHTDFVSPNEAFLLHVIDLGRNQAPTILDGHVHPHAQEMSILRRPHPCVQCSKWRL